MDNILEVKGICKYFGSTIANNNIDFYLQRGEIRGLAGENGSGKSTLLQQIAGIYLKDKGTMLLNGKEYNPRNPMDAKKNKIGIVVQELGVLNTLPAGINVFAGNWKKFSKFGIINLKQMYREANKIFEEYGLMKIPMNGDCEIMHIERRKMLELARALADDPDILILDEVTQSLSQNNREMLYKLIHRLQQEGKTIIMITHDLEEMLELCDNITVLRDGEVIDTKASSELDPDKIKRLMVGREVNSAYYREDQKADYSEKVVLKAVQINKENVLQDVSFELHKGEILGFCGLSDSGIHEIGTALYGLSDNMTGEVVLTEGNVKIKNERIANANGMAYVPKDRDGAALMIRDSIQNNFVLPSTKELQGKCMYLNPMKLRNFTQHGIDEFNVKCTGPNQKMSDLSGGNKQKVNLGRWLMKDLKVLILDCPTRGVDVSVKAYVYQMMQEVKKKGLSMILISDELPEVLGMSDRLIVMKDGMIKGEFFRGENFTQEALIEVMV
jgi:ribose transport system ATP-binding protein